MSATNSPSACRIANIALNDAMILPHHANPRRMDFSETTRFPQLYHEPYYESYVSEDFPAIARRCALAHRRDIKAFVSNVMVFDKA